MLVRWQYKLTTFDYHYYTAKVSSINIVLMKFLPLSDIELFSFSALTLLFGWQKGHPACKN